MILLDFPTKRTRGYCHLVASTIEELHVFAESIGLKRSWFENKKGKNRPHYDIKGFQINEAIKAGAKQVDSRELVRFLRANYC